MQGEGGKQEGAPEPKQRLVLAAIACIERFGVGGVTSRRLAAEAGVNVSAVNYYFGSKAALLDLALAETLRATFDDPLAEFDQLLSQGATAQEALRHIVRETLEGSLEYPKIAHAHLKSAVEEQRYDGAVVIAMNEFLAALDKRLAKAGAGRSS